MGKLSGGTQGGVRELEGGGGHQRLIAMWGIGLRQPDPRARMRHTMCPFGGYVWSMKEDAVQQVVNLFVGQHCNTREWPRPVGAHGDRHPSGGISAGGGILWATGPRGG